MRTSGAFLLIFLLGWAGWPTAAETRPSQAESTVRAPEMEPSWQYDTGG